eukprot:TRINITY_DN7362_c0_g1_i1.p1 TRINITY_DN7362_c0_g1~~TRINITY_DN7362_c0_g1_i1.p1  ORF type:complete len:1651 (+),score=528.93 TRINITY_DN7362_c0_g1_i1:646-4953(+)
MSAASSQRPRPPRIEEVFRQMLADREDELLQAKLSVASVKAGVERHKRAAVLRKGLGAAAAVAADDKDGAEEKGEEGAEKEGKRKHLPPSLPLYAPALPRTPLPASAPNSAREFVAALRASPVMQQRPARRRTYHTWTPRLPSSSPSLSPESSPRKVVRRRKKKVPKPTPPAHRARPAESGETQDSAAAVTTDASQEEPATQEKGKEKEAAAKEKQKRRRKKAKAARSDAEDPSGQQRAGKGGKEMLSATTPPRQLSMVPPRQASALASPSTGPEKRRHPGPEHSYSPPPAPTPPLAVTAPQLVNTTLKQIKQHSGDAAAINAGLNSLAQVCGYPTMQKEAKKWLGTRQGTAEDDHGGDLPKYGDGIADAKAPDEVEKIQFYDADWEPPHVVEATMEDVSRWWTPMGHLWPEYVGEDLLGSCHAIQEFHSAGQPAVLVQPLYVYSISVFRRLVWAVWVGGNSPDVRGRWAVVKSGAEDLEEAFTDWKASSDDGMFLEPKFFRGVQGLAANVPSVVQLQAVPSLREDYGMRVFQSRGFVLVRYENDLRGNTHYAPLYDTVLWLCAPVERQKKQLTFRIPIHFLPPPGILDYLHSRRSDENLVFPDWHSRTAIGAGAQRLILSCLDVQDQQKYSAQHDTEFQRVLWDPSQLIVSQRDKPSKEVPSALIRTLILEKLEGELQPTPQMIAHALDIQILHHAGRSYLLALSGSRFFIADVRRQEVAELWRLKDGFDDQPYWHLNAAMRNKQFGNEKAKLTVKKRTEGDKRDPLAGNYECNQEPISLEQSLQPEKPPLPSLQQVRDPQDQPPAMRRQSIARTTNTNWAMFTQNTWTVRTPSGEMVPLQADHCHFNIGTYLLPQVRPLIWYLDKALELLRQVDENALGQQVRPGPDGIKNFRGLAGVRLERGVYDTGKVVLWGQYSSSSKDRGVATAFAASTGAAAIFTLTGKQCVCIAQWSRFAREREWLYPPNTMFKVTSSLSEEHQEILGKSNIQIFTMEEVDELGALEVFVRSCVPRVQGATAPEHVMQLFQALHLFQQGDPDDVLALMLDPAQPALCTREGRMVCEKLIKLGADADQLNSAFLRACAGGHDEAIHILLDMGANPNAESKDGKRAIHFAAARSHYNAVRTLLGAGASAQVFGGGFTPLEWAALRRDHNIADLLRSHTPLPAHPVPSRLDEFRPQVRVIRSVDMLRHLCEASGIAWAAAREKHAGQLAHVALFDKPKKLFWLRFTDGSTDTYPDGVFAAPAALEEVERGLAKAQGRVSNWTRKRLSFNRAAQAPRPQRPAADDFGAIILTPRGGVKGSGYEIPQHGSVATPDSPSAVDPTSPRSGIGVMGAMGGMHSLVNALHKLKSWRNRTRRSVASAADTEGSIDPCLELDSHDPGSHWSALDAAGVPPGPPPPAGLPASAGLIPAPLGGPPSPRRSLLRAGVGGGL